MAINDGTNKKRGFAAMSREQADEIRRKGGKASPMKFKSGDKRAAELGRRGGKASRRSAES